MILKNSIFEAVYENAKECPDKLCVADEECALTYREYFSLIAKYSSLLSSMGIGKGDRVVVEASQTAKYLAFQLGLQAIGGIFVPLELGCAETKIANVAKVCDAKLIVTQKEKANAVRLDELFEKAQNEKEFVYTSFPKKDDVCELLFSTGTTGKEKGIVIINENNIALAENVIGGVEMKEDNVELIPAPLNHSHGLRRYYANMLCKASVVLSSGVMNLLGFFNAIEKYNVTAIDLVPTALTILLKLSKNKFGEYKDRLRYIQFGSAPLMQADKDKLKELLPNTRLYNFYGSTESGCIAIYDFNDSKDKSSCIGKPTVNARIFAVDENRNEMETSREKTGLLASFGKMNMIGYWKDEAETAAALENGVIYTKDEIYFDEDGDIILLGRKSDVINVAGNKVSPEEIENLVKKLDCVADCACVPAPDAVKGNVPKLFVEMKPGCEFDASLIRKAVSENAEPYKVPQYIVQIDKVPRTFNGKIIRRKLME